MRRSSQAASIVATQAGSALDARHSSESNEHYSPPPIVEPARVTLGGIDLDPASCRLANTVVRARRIFTQEQDGFARPWRGRVFLNPPGGHCDETGRPVFVKTKKREGCSVTGACGLPPGHAHRGLTSSAKAWWFRLVEEYLAGRVTSAIFVGFTVEILQSTQVEPPRSLPAAPAFPLCLPMRRVAYLRQATAEERSGGAAELVPGASPTHAGVILYLPPREAEARRAGLQRFVAAFTPIGAVVGPFRNDLFASTGICSEAKILPAPGATAARPTSRASNG